MAGKLLATICCEARSRRPLKGQDSRHAEFVEGADLLIHDAQYTAAEYPSKVGWGHSSVEFVVQLARLAHVKAVALIHHDPLRSDDQLDHIVEGLKTDRLTDELSPEIYAATEGQCFEITSSGERASSESKAEFDAMSAVVPTLSDRTAILSVKGPNMSAALAEALHAEGIHADYFSTSDAGRELIAKHQPSLALIEYDGNDDDTMSMCRSIREGEAGQLPLILVAERENAAIASSVGASDWLIAPFSNSYARTKIRAWILRTTCRWARAPIPEDEPRRISSLRALGLLDTEPDERFDRITRLAAALFDVPMATITLVDVDRQWFKSCVGVKERENSRDVSFCAHVVHGREPMIVPDTLHDSRFADNPLVIDEPWLRFYAGHPLVLDDGSCVGTLCLLDTRPRMLDSENLERLEDLANIVMQEIQNAARADGH